MCRYFINPYREQEPRWETDITSPFQSGDVQDLHRSLDAYRPTPLVRLPELAETFGVGEILVKDESHRFGLKAFKALGASYAIYRFLHRYYKERNKFVSLPRNFYRNTGAVEAGRFTFCTATDGNHGRGVAWTARQLRQRAVIFMPSKTVPSRIDNIEIEGARVVLIDGTYDETVAAMSKQAEENGWQIISDMSWTGYEEIPRWIMAGYTTLFKEVDQALKPKEKIDLVIVQVGCGSLAGTAAWYYNKSSSANRPRLLAVEPTEAGCVMESIRSSDGEVHSLVGEQHSIMAGLNCGTPAPVAWPLLKSGFDLFITVPDSAAIDAMRRYHKPAGEDPSIVSGESGAAGLAALTVLMTESKMASAREQLKLGPQSTVMLLNTEGDTDPDHYGRVISS